MLDFLEIENFRCFEQFKIEGLAQVNLFGGLNNSGKTALLEAFALATNHSLYFNDKNFQKMRNLPQRSVDGSDNLFYRRETHKNIIVYSNFRKEIFSKNRITDPHPYSDTLHKFIYITAKGFTIPDTLNLPNSFDLAELKERKTQIMQMLQCVDPKIIDARTFATRDFSIYLRRSVEELWFPMENLGDAAQKVLNYALNIYYLADDAATEKVLIIDEIENGLHYTVQESFWEQLFNLAKQFNIQIFAATHSLEMIKAYLNTIKKLGENAVSNKYWELFRNQKRNKIMAADRSAEQLEYVLSTPLNFRGE